MLFGLAGAKQINGSIYRCPPKVAFGFFYVRAQGIAPQHAQEDRLQDIFRICGITGNPVRRPEHQAVVFLKNAAEFRSLRKNRDLSGCELQIPPPLDLCFLSALKTEGWPDYYGPSKKRWAR